MNRTRIEWVRNPDGSQGFTWNPLTGCLNHINGMCKGGGFPCYAYKLAHGRLNTKYLANKVTAPLDPQIDGAWSKWNKADPFWPRFWPERLKTPYNPIMPVGIFVCDMGELFGDWVPRYWQEQIFEVIEGRPQHRFYLLTKQPQNLIKFSPFPENCWVGVTATGGEFAWSAGAWIRMVKAKVKFLSIEPFLKPFHNEAEKLDFTRAVIEQFDWLIIGALTGRKCNIMELAKQYLGLTPMPWDGKWMLQPKIEWVNEIVLAADRAGIPVFQKDNLKPILGNNLRQEIPR